MMISALGTVIMVSGLLRERFQDYYGNGFRIITGTVSGLLREHFQDYYENGFRLLLERFQIITGTVSNYYWNGFRLLLERFRIVTRTPFETV